MSAKEMPAQWRKDKVKLGRDARLGEDGGVSRDGRS